VYENILNEQQVRMTTGSMEKYITVKFFTKNNFDNNYLLTTDVFNAILVKHRKKKYV